MPAFTVESSPVAKMKAFSTSSGIEFSSRPKMHNLTVRVNVETAAASPTAFWMAEFI